MKIKITQELDSSQKLDTEIQKILSGVYNVKQNSDTKEWSR